MKRWTVIVNCMVIVGGLSGVAYIAGQHVAVATIRASCDDQKQEKTMIGDRAYFCDEYENFSEQMKNIANAMRQRGT